jgi:uncharacterized protein YndB with AHSA1/START domain
MSDASDGGGAQDGVPVARVERVLAAAPGEAYDAWLDEAALQSFICPAPGRAAEVSVDARVGGGLRFLMAFPDGEIEVTGEFVALDRPERICFTWRCSDTGELESMVTVLLAPHGEGQTLMTIIHSRQPASLVPKHSEGWTSVAEQLAQRLAPVA